MMKLIFCLGLFLLAVEGVKAQGKVGRIHNDTAYIEWIANDEAQNAEELRAYQLTAADLVVLQSTGANGSNKKWVAAFKLLQTDTCTGCQPVYHIVGKSEGLFRIGKWYGNQTVAAIKKLNDLRTEQLAFGQKLLVGFCKMPISRPKLLTDSLESGIGVKQANQVPATVQQPSGKDSVLVLPKPAPLRPVDPEPELTYSGHGFFEAEWKPSNAANSRPGKAAIFKSASGWQDGKFYLLTGILPPGALVKVLNPATQKYVVAKVLAPLPQIKMNEGLICRLNDAAAALLGCLHQKTFELIITASN